MFCQFFLSILSIGAYTHPINGKHVLAMGFLSSTEEFAPFRQFGHVAPPSISTDLEFMRFLRGKGGKKNKGFMDEVDPIFKDVVIDGEIDTQDVELKEEVSVEKKISPPSGVEKIMTPFIDSFLQQFGDRILAAETEEEIRYFIKALINSGNYVLKQRKRVLRLSRLNAYFGTS
jgi:hypothetical protein